MDVAYRTEVGHVRTRNEDAVLARPERGLLAVADGLGGHPAGDVASLTAVRALDVSDVGSGADGDHLVAAARAAHEAVLAAAADHPERHGMGTTLVLAVVDGQSAQVVHVGDSRAYLLRDDVLHPLTQDHGLHGYLTQALGLDRDVVPDAVTADCPAGSRLLLCTDGLTNMVDDSDIRTLLSGGSAEEACDALVTAALDAGGVDNVSVVVAAF